MSQKKQLGLFWYGVAILNVVLATALTHLWQSELSQSPMLLFVVAVVSSTLGGGLGPGLLAVGLSVLSIEAYFISPVRMMDWSVAVPLRLGGLSVLAVIVYLPLIARRRAEQRLWETLAELEQQVDRRTQELSAAHLSLTEEIAERQRALEREQAARAQAETANRLKDEFLATVSHELRTPLSAITGWARLLSSGVVEENKVRYALEVIDRNAQAQTQLVNDLLDVSRIISGKLLIKTAAVNPARVITSAVSTIRLAAEARAIRLELDLSPEPLLVSGDADRLQQVFWNLLANAVKFTPEGGRISVHLDTVGHQAQISVCDSGQGIPEDFLPCVFDRFSQADGSTTRRHGGLGLGLAIVRHLVELHGGTVQAESAGDGMGATFIVRLPLLAEQALATAAAPETGAAGMALSATPVALIAPPLPERLNA